MYLLSLAQLLSATTLHLLYAAAYKPLSDSFLRAIPPPTTVDPTNGTLLAPLLIPRVPGTPGQKTAQAHLHSFFTTQLPSWTLTWQNSTSTTPATGSVQIPFANLIAKREPPWTKPGEANLLTLVAHYDSKRVPEGFVGATDSAVPCAVLMYTAQVLDRYVSQMYGEMSELGEGGEVDMDMGVQILFLDGEEAFERWTDEDSLYGARSLAETWAATPNPAGQKFYRYRTPLNQIPLFLLLDLLGAPSPMVPSYFPTTHWAYLALSTVETRMRALNLLESSPAQNFLPDVNASIPAGAVSDDHLPFIARGVETLHVIPHPFPGVWHTLRDDGEHLDMRVVRDWCRIVAGFALEWLDMMEVWTEPEGGGGVGE
ncbi:hypothetical protein CC80DRAFT_494510 [Byssothecium circinans]|uniref:Peptide hydrolase n=1 Tax=Byssothecium circinans TaxID=147558 RepID=A0A6A5TN28_9PLEO|nr:hypothetical protein CC80DRAFT_494510 [Byssothecium circinans]